jgi:flagellar basal-body rod modification protein FlgD
MTTDTVASSSLLKNVTRYEDAKDAAKKTSEDMGKQDFLTLFTAQLQNQNPLEPVKNEAFVAQLAQFSQLEALTNM